MPRPRKRWPIRPCPSCERSYRATRNHICCPRCSRDPELRALAESRRRRQLEGQNEARDAERAARMLSAGEPLIPIAAERIIEMWGRE